MKIRLFGQLLETESLKDLLKFRLEYSGRTPTYEPRLRRPEKRGCAGRVEGGGGGD